MARDDSARTMIYEEPSLLDMPPAPEGFIYRWIRVQLLSDQGYIDDLKNIAMREREGWVFVKDSELDPEWRGRLPTRDKGSYKGYVGHSDVALAKIEAERAEARQHYYEKRAQDMESSINEQLKQEGRKNKTMPIFNESTSNVTRGSRSTSFD